jgi:hypothetical protein
LFGQMERRSLAWLLSLTLMVVGGFFAHALAYRLVAPEPARSHRHGAADVHGYLIHWRMCLAVCCTIALVALAASVLTRVWAHGAVAAPGWLFALFPPVGFVVQEHLERLIATGTFPLAAALEPTFAVGLLLQLPFALAAYLVARALIGLAVAVVRRLAREPRRWRLAREPARRPCAQVAVVRVSALALGHGQRAPPVAA